MDNDSSSDVRYDTIRYDMVYLRALKVYDEGHLIFAHGTEKMRKTFFKKNNKLALYGIDGRLFTNDVSAKFKVTWHKKTKTNIN